MNLKSTLIITLCFTLLCLGVFFSYKKFYFSIVYPDQESQQKINPSRPGSDIYFQSGNSYYFTTTNTSFERLFLADKTLVQKDSANAALLKETDSSTLKSIITEKGTYLLKREMINNQETINLYFNDIKNNTNMAITMVSAPLAITNFEISSNAGAITFQISNLKNEQSNIGISNLDGTNSLELTSDGNAYFPVFSPDGTKIAFWKKDQGIYIMNRDGSNLNKILNYKSKINQIIAWR